LALKFKPPLHRPFPVCNSSTATPRNLKGAVHRCFWSIHPKASEQASILYLQSTMLLLLKGAVHRCFWSIHLKASEHGVRMLTCKVKHASWVASGEAGGKLILGSVHWSFAIIRLSQRFARGAGSWGNHPLYQGVT